MSKVILGIDPGFAILGWGIINSLNRDNINSVEWGAISTKSSINIEARLFKIYNDLVDVIDKYKPDEIAIEKVFFNNNAKTAITVGQAQGVVFLLSAMRNIPIFQYTPLQVKSGLTGYGVADKKQVQNMLKLVLKLDTIPKPDDAADGVAIALCHLQTNRFL